MRGIQSHTTAVNEAAMAELYLTELHLAVPDDLEFFARIELENEGYASSYTANWTAPQWADQRRKILGFLRDDDKFALLMEDPSCGRPISGICIRMVDFRVPLPSWSVFRMLPREHFPTDGLFCEVYQLWVDPVWRRRGLATRLKIEAERVAAQRGAGAIYTHTEAANQYVIDLNLKIGYRVIRRGPIWDDVERVSLIKSLT